MDHILSAEEVDKYGNYVPEIPWLGYDHQPSQDLLNFEDYALHRGWSQENLVHLKEGRLEWFDKASLKPFLQSWFSIGLLEAVLGKGLEKDNFITSKGSSTFFTSEPLRQIAADLEAQFNNATTEDPSKTVTLARFICILGPASVWHRMLDDVHLFVIPNSDFCDETYHAIMRMFILLGTSLQYTGEQLAVSLSADRVISARYKAQLSNPWFPSPTWQESLRDRMAKRGWCPYIGTVLSSFNSLVIEYAAVIGPPATHFDHHSCSPTECVRHNIDASTYRPLHTMPDCQCPFVRPRVDLIADILDSGQIPLMDFNGIHEGETGKFVDVVAFDSGKSGSERLAFHAVSHVWSGGTGSVSEDGLPECVIRRLEGYMRSNTGSKPVWIDSLCIPRNKRLRKLSIQTISTVFSQAHATLVLDPELMRTSTSSSRQMVMWITTAVWMQRMWTLPEGRLSRRVYIAFKDCAASYLDIIVDANQDYGNPVTGALTDTLFGILSVNGIRFIHKSLSYRTTSWREDEALALAILFEMDTSHVLNAETLDERMSLFWKSLSRKVPLPMNIIFLRVPKLPTPGLRWAPRTLLNVGRQLSLLQPASGDTSYDVEMSDNGTLTGRYVVIWLDERATILLDRFNPIRLAIARGPDPTEMIVGSATLLSYNQAGTALESGSLDGIDAFAVNATHLEAKSGELLADQLAAAVRTVLALTFDNDGKQYSTNRTRSHEFHARYILQLSPIETKGDELTGTVEWARISIS